MVVRGKNSEEFAATMQLLLVEDIHPQLVNSVHTLGVHLESLLVLSSHTAVSSSKAFYYLCLSRKLHRILEDKKLASVIHTFVTSQFDYRNAIYLGGKPSVLRKLQLAQILQHLSSTI